MGSDKHIKKDINWLKQMKMMLCILNTKRQLYKDMLDDLNTEGPGRLKIISQTRKDL